MKILSVLLENLNSLQGKWVIDFTTQAFVDNGLFAITGPTGAGKSTILDAICIALYHETPRLSSLTKTNAEVMNKDKGYCSAEVRFEVQGKIYLAKWSIRRSRNRADGNLQAPTGTLTCETTQTDITTKLSDKVPAVVALTKLNFKRFTKSMMLSQGEFSAFLNAGDNDRSELLEQLTGTEIYSDISKRVFDEHKQLRQQLALLQTAQSAKAILTDTEKDQLNTNIASTQGQFVSDKAQLDNLITHQHWWQQYTRLMSAQADANKELANAQAFQREQQPVLAQLALARPAHKLTPLYNNYVGLQTRCNQLESSVTSQQEQIPDLTMKCRDADTQYQQAEQDYRQQLQHQHELNELVNEHIIPLDGKIAATQKQVNDIEATLTLTDESITTLTTALDEDKSTLIGLNTQRDTVTTYLSEHQSDSQLEANIGIWKVEYQTWLKLAKAHAADSAVLHDALAKVLEINPAQTDPSQELKPYLTQIQTAITQSITALSATMSVYFSEQALPVFLSEILDSSAALQSETLAECARFYQAQIKPEQALWRLHDQLVETRNAHNVLTQAHATGQATLDQYHLQLPSLKQQAESDNTIYELAKNNLSMQQQLAHYSEQLAEHDTCPLCASAEFGDYQTLHAQHNQQATDGTLTQQLSEYKDAQQASNEALNQLTQTINIQASILANNLAEQVTSQEKITELTTRCAEQASHLGMSFSATHLNKLINQLQARDEIRHTLLQLEQYASVLQKHQALDGIRVQIAEQQAHILQLVQAAGFTELTIDDIGTRFRTWLIQKNDDLSTWQAHQEQQSIIKQQIQTLEQRRLFNQEQLSQAHTDLAKAQAQQTQLQQSLTTAITERKRRFGDKDPIQAVTSMREQVEQRASRQATLLQTHQDLATALATLDTRLEKDRESLVQENVNLTTAKSEFMDALALSVFATEAEFSQACVDEQVLENLISIENAVNTTLSETASVVKQVQKTVDQHYALENADYYQSITAEVVSEQLAQQQTQFETISAQLGQLKGLYEQNEKAENDIISIKSEMDNLIQKINIAGYLDELIGSSDGKKFRKFAQGLTLDNLIYLANRQLVDFDGRYELKRKDNQSLDMVVVDRWQGDTERDTRTLSGGESFLVSLALALGLSDLVSQEISIDSLFLDEGFGTLDSDTLDTALDVLDTLNAKGKMIGVISHVEAMKQRIPLQIKITKQSGLGISTLDEQYRFVPVS